MAEKYLIVMTTVLVATQIIRVTQNTIQLVRQNKMIKKETDRLGDVTDEDMAMHREFYKLGCEYLSKLKEDR
ncbi:hypothetical protein [Eubacterium ramulus]|jgi:hypothetical protein|nr:MAG: hypothetical protein [Bacteriophage sp.]DAK76728.1 MAG TPA: hypothetical protein [Caudoviricetes sp.]